ncbi:hypothetical protein WJX84_003787 [Apatococcus fuscideae]|uniref:Uncharacterized protein n=1 Tax=Apatococcus fuscideae TaxID=2026836 RepID=A0AAW1SSK0_9CHLO
MKSNFVLERLNRRLIRPTWVWKPDAAFTVVFNLPLFSPRTDSSSQDLAFGSGGACHAPSSPTQRQQMLVLCPGRRHDDSTSRPIFSMSTQVTSGHAIAEEPFNSLTRRHTDGILAALLSHSAHMALSLSHLAAGLLSCVTGSDVARDDSRGLEHPAEPCVGQLTPGTEEIRQRTRYVSQKR